MEKFTLARDIIQFHFGDLYAQVFWQLCTHGACSFRELVKRSNLPTVKVRTAVAVLLQHDAACAFEKVGAQPCLKRPWNLPDYEESDVLFEAKETEVLLRLRYPRFTQLARDYYGETGEILAQVLLERGCLPFNDIIEVGISKGRLKSSAAADSVLRHMIEDRVVQLVGYELTEPSVKSKFVTSGSKRRREDIEQSVKTEIESMEDDNNSEKTFSQNRLEVYRLSTHSLNRILKHEAFIDLIVHIVRENSRMAASCMRALLSLTRREDEYLESNHSVPVQKESILEELRNHKTSSSDLVTSDQLSEVLSLLREERYGFITPIGTSSYVADLGKMSSTLKQRATEQLILKRYGTSGLRIFRLLLDKGSVEQRQLLEYAMLPGNSGRERLYAMLRDGYVVVNEIPSSSDYKSSRSFFLWSIDISQVHEHVLGHAYKATLNMLTRLIELYDNFGALVGFHGYYGILEASETFLISHQSDTHLLTGTNVNASNPEFLEQVRKLQQQIALYEVSILRLDKNIMCMRDF
eukprot:jgi/Galph1/1362/GphlegSOOS_G6023.1